MLAVRPGDAQLAALVPAQPAMARVDVHAAVAQASEPGAQQRRGLHVGGKHPAGTADEGVDAQTVNPLAQRIRTEGFQQRAQCVGAFAVAADERGEVLGVGDVHPADAGQQELASDRRHRIVKLDRDAGLAQHLGRHQTGGAAADDGDTGRAGGTGHNASLAKNEGRAL